MAKKVIFKNSKGEVLKVYGKTINGLLCYVWYENNSMYAANVHTKKIIGEWSLADLANTWPLQLK